jgi:hypothetical protein
VKRFILGLLGGVLAGVAVAVLLGSGGGEGPTERARSLATTARRALDEARRRVRPPRPAATEGGAPAPTGTARPPLPAKPLAAVQGWWNAVRARWREAVAEGQRASAEAQRELRRRYEQLTGRA